MSDKLTNPLLSHPVFAPIVAEVQGGALGQPLAAYASARTKASMSDPLMELGLPVIDFLLHVFGEEVVAIMATNEQVRGEGFDAWFLCLRFSGGLVATVDLGNFLPATYPDDLELRLELSGTDNVIIAEPENVAVTVIGVNGTSRDESYGRSYQDNLRHFVTAVGDEEQRAVRKVIEAARQSAVSDQLVKLA